MAWKNEYHRHRIASQGSNIRGNYVITDTFSTLSDFRLIDKSSPIMDKLKFADSNLKRTTKVNPEEKKFYAKVSSLSEQIVSEVNKLHDKFGKVDINSPTKIKEEYVSRLVALKQKVNNLLETILTHDYTDFRSDKGKMSIGLIATQLNNLKYRIVSEIDRISPGHKEGLKTVMQKLLDNRK